MYVYDFLYISVNTRKGKTADKYLSEKTCTQYIFGYSYFVMFVVIRLYTQILSQSNLI